MWSHLPDVQLQQALATSQRVLLRGAGGSHLALLLARLAYGLEAPPPLVIVTADERRASELVADLTFFLGGREDARLDLPEAVLIPAIDASPYAEVVVDRVAVMERLSVLRRLTLGPTPTVMVLSASALRRRVLPRRVFGALCQEVAVDDEPGRDALVANLDACGYTHVPVVDDPGTYSVRGAIVDIFSPLSRFPTRVELFDEIVESLRLFDPISQRTFRAVDRVDIQPIRETVRDVEDVAGGVRERLLALADVLSHPTRNTRALLEQIESGRDFFGAAAMTPAYHSQLDPLFSYLPQDAIWVLDEPDVLFAELASEDTRSAVAYESWVSDGHLAFPVERFFVPAEELKAQLFAQRRVELSLAEGDAETPRVECIARDNAELQAELKRARAERGEMILKGLCTKLRGWSEEGCPVLIAAGSAAHVERLESLLQGQGLEVLIRKEEGVLELLERDVQLSGVVLQVGSLQSGFRLPRSADAGTGESPALVVLSHEDIFGPKSRRRPSRRAPGVSIGDLRQLKVGDHLVHADHGVGIYRGLEQLKVDGVAADYLLIEFRGGDKYYLPVHRMSQVARYVGAEGGKPTLDRLGGTTWQKKKKKVESDVRKLGEELLQLYAQRAALSGKSFHPPGAEMVDFEESFPFTETEDQQQAIDDVLGDLAAERPMDRLVCGDVGFGKTEVALRAAFVMAMNGKQVALLAPTTVLVEQHLRSFAERFTPYPLRVESVSRFRRAKELRVVLEDLAAGKVDVVIGTHRLFSSDVRFADLGLLIIDEEQRFGVKNKEQIKQLRSQVEVLTLSATPIPRTLQMSMIGLREFSVIATPPADRQAIRTVICRYDDALVADAIRRELSRGGQVFFVHNEVQSIDEQAGRIAELVPEARVGVGHGQMDARRLERVMLDFVSNRFDVLVCSTIIESGLDIPRANTMFVSRADRFGLSQLYQLRGRIGRGRERAYCYLLVPGFEALSGEARQRLEVLQRFTQLGAGFAVASYDLEIRGAGDLLGGRQSGHIAALGFEAYARILEESVAELKGEPIVRETDPELKVAVGAFIPDDYVEDPGVRLEFYKRLSDVCRQEQQVHEILQELRDRYGNLPVEVNALGELMAIKGIAIDLGATLVDVGETRVNVRLGETTPLDPAKVTEVISDPARRLRLTPDMRLMRVLAEDERKHPLSACKRLLHELAALA
ncbi:MAG: transcription-repair coupling factor [Deltaproteobacteria bacterium]|nr:transcription-repair coupling factor [Deltaproteobacteria bacterium]